MEYINLENSTPVLFKKDLPKIFEGRGSKLSSDDPYYEVLDALSGTITEVQNYWRGNDNNMYRVSNAGHSKNIYPEYIERVITKDERPEYYL